MSHMIVSHLLTKSTAEDRTTHFTDVSHKSRTQKLFLTTCYGMVEQKLDQAVEKFLNSNPK